jgi:oligopeptide/dipeptide ABC transporter ATP-binding protein
LKLSEKELRKIRKHIQIIFQDPSSSLNPRFPVGKIIEEPLIYNTSLVKKERIERVLFLLEKVGISTDKYSSYPYEFSGGQKQRISIARALASGPELIICDEPVSSLDVSIQAQIINLLMDLQKDFNLSILFISHDISVVKQISRNILVMYMGKIIESGEASKIYFNSVHPYTKLLICSIPGYISKNDTVIPLIENLENIHRHSSCSFVSRCSLAQNICNENEPRLEKIAENHYAACFFVENKNSN